MEIKSVALLGAGAVGSYIIWGLSRLEHINFGVVFCEAEPPFDSERALAVEKLMQKAAIHIRRTDCIKEEMWAKFRLNVCNNLPQAVIGVGLVCYKDSSHMQAIS